jgi:TonB family protein
MSARWAGVGLVLASLWPLAACAEALDIPELGVRIPNLPPGTAKPEVYARVNGYSALLRIGTATLSIARVQEAVPAGSDVREASYRTAQEAAFYEDLGAKVHGEATSINGHAAWTNNSAVRSGDRPVSWSCVTYVIADQHLYRFTAAAWGGEKPPADYTAAVQAMSDATFVPVEVPSDVTPSGLLAMPPPHWMGIDYYPASAKRRGEEGVVGLEFGIDTKGHVRDVRKLYGTSTELDNAAIDCLQHITLEVGPRWEAKGYDKLRFTSEVRFALAESGHCGKPPPPRIPGAWEVHICGSRLR